MIDLIWKQTVLFLQKTLFVVEGVEITYDKILKIALPTLLMWYCGRLLIAILRKKKIFVWDFLGKAAKIVELLMRILFLIAGVSLGFRLAGIKISIFYYVYKLLFHPIFTLGDSPVSIMSLIFLIIIIYASIFIARRVKLFLDNSIFPQTNLDRGMQDVIHTFLKYFIIAVAVVIGLQFNGIDLTVFATIGAGLMVGLGFGLQNIANNFVSGIIILLERPIKVGDYVELEGVTGLVEKISSRSTHIRNFHNIIMIVPNSKLISENVINWSHNNETVLLKIPIGISYKSDPEKAKQVLLDIANTHPLILDNPAPDVQLREFGDSSINLSLLAWTNEAFERFKIMSDVNFELFKQFREHNIQIPFPQVDIHFPDETLE